MTTFARTLGLRARLSGVWHRALSFVVLALVLVGAVTAGRSYLWCSMMEAAVDTCCCASTASDDGAIAPATHDAELRSGCCEHRAHDDLTKTRAAADALEVPAALPVLATSAPVVVAVAAVPSYPPVLPRTLRASPIRDGPRAASETCVRLQVFRC